MKSIKPGRGPSGMSFISSVCAIIFGVFWTLLAISFTGGMGLVGLVFPLFGLLFIGQGVATAIYHYKNATGKDRCSAFDITDSCEEGDPANCWIKGELEAERRAMDAQRRPSGADLYCPYCGAELDSDFRFCPKCGRQRPD